MALSAAYRGVVRAADVYVPARLRPLWEHPAGEWSAEMRAASAVQVSMLLRMSMALYISHSMCAKSFSEMVVLFVCTLPHQCSLVVRIPISYCR